MGLDYVEILALLAKKHHYIVSYRHLKRISKKLRLFRRKHYTPLEDVVAFIKDDIRGSGRLHGYHWMLMKCRQAGLTVRKKEPPDSGDNSFTLIEHSLDQAVDTGVENIVILGDFNEDYLKPSNVRMKNIIRKYDMFQFIDEPTHFTENSTSCLDLFRNKTVNVIRKQQQDYINGLVAKLRSYSLSIKSWWITASHLAGFKSRESDIPPLFDNKDFLYNDIDKAEAFNAFFVSQSNIFDENMSVPTDDTPPVTCLDNIILQEHEVKDILQITNVNKASGPGGISPRLLKIASDILAKPLCYIFNLSLTKMYYPLA
ncbi:unnamed protein product [Mytilus coruscus]|uniref:Endonuclease/exonuclease/phosphatase domain-containing protein n=1 Tax=Mytilus coruscus TaxID=42192 RepID=A0A6J8ADS3_MYTCO|nr:unnamed protein product [Mytilus coruscus]